MTRRTYDEVLRARAELIRVATLDTQRSCVNPGCLVDKRPSDQYWMERFALDRADDLDAAMAHLFLVSFQLTNRVPWHKAQVAIEIKTLVSRKASNPVEVVAALANELRRSNRRRYRQTSAASKVAMFAKPEEQVFIWDGLTACSARARDWHRAGRQTARHSRDVFRGPDGGHSYNQHHAACARALSDERLQKDFKDAVTDVEAFLVRVGGPMKDRTLVPKDFVERRLLDKLMFWEGWFMKKGDFRDIYKLCPTCSCCR